MTTYFVSNAGSNTAPYDTEAKAATTLGVIAALPWAATDVVKVSSTHTETASAAISYTFPTTVGLQVLSVTFDGSGTGAVAAGGTINVGASSNAFNLVNGFVYVYGITFVGGTNNNGACDLLVGSTATLPIGMTFDTCTFSVPSINASANLAIGGTGNAANDDTVYRLIDCVFSKGSSTSILVRHGRIEFSGVSLSGTAPTTVFTLSGSGQALAFTCNASDLSGSAWTNLFDVSGGSTGLAVFSQCKLPSGFTVSTGTIPGPGGLEIILQDCDSGDVNYSYIKTNWSGTITTSNAIYADASDGTNSFSLKMVSSANASFTWPLISPDLVQFNATLAALSSTVEVDNDGTTFTDAELWQETMAKVTSGVPQGTWNRADRVSSIIASAANQTTSTKTWTGTGGFGAEVKQKLVSGSFTPAEVGAIVTVAKLAKASATVYVSPNVAVA